MAHGCLQELRLKSQAQMMQLPFFVTHTEFFFVTHTHAKRKEAASGLASSSLILAPPRHSLLEVLRTTWELAWPRALSEIESHSWALPEDPIHKIFRKNWGSSNNLEDDPQYLSQKHYQNILRILYFYHQIFWGSSKFSLKIEDLPSIFWKGNPQNIWWIYPQNILRIFYW